VSLHRSRWRVVLPRGRRSGPLASRSLLGLVRCRTGLRGFSTTTRRRSPPRGGTAVRTLGSWLPFGARPCRPGRIAPTFLSWGSRGRRSAGRFVRGPRPFAPPPTPRPSVHSRARRRTLRIREGHSRILVPSSWFRASLTVSSARRSRACCIPLPVLGFAAFLGPGFPASPVRNGSSWECRGDPRDAPHTPRRSPLDCSRTTSPWPLPPCRWRPPPLARSRHRRCRGGVCGWGDGNLDFEALLRCRVRSADRPLPADGRPLLPLGLVPLQGPSRGQGRSCA